MISSKFKIHETEIEYDNYEEEKVQGCCGECT